MYKISKENKLLKVLSLNAIAIIISFILGIASTKIISLYLGTAGMALLGSFKNFSTMLKSIATLGINNSLIKLICENKEDKIKIAPLYSTFLWIFLSIACVLAVFVVIFSSFLSKFIFFTSSYSVVISLFGIMLPLVVLNAFWIAIYNGWEQFKKIVLIQIISNIFIFALSTLLILKQQIYGALIAIALAEFIAFIVTLLFVQKNNEIFSFKLLKAIDKQYLKVIKNFSGMALLSAVLVPITLIGIRNFIIKDFSLQEAGIWDGINRLSGFYMLFFSSGLAMYYFPKLASLKTEQEFITELKSYFKFFMPLFFIVMIGIFVFRSFIIQICFTKEFFVIKELIVWQLLGDFFKIMSLAFGYQILIKMKVKKYIMIELFFNSSYFFLSNYLMKFLGVEGVVKAYFLANLFTFVFFLIIFKNLFFLKLKKNNRI